MVTTYLTLKALHIIAVISWMAGMLYLPRLFVYHAESVKDSEMDKTFQTMERRLLRVIMNPAMIFTYIFGISLVLLDPSLYKSAGWFHSKFLLVLLLTGLHGYFSKCRKNFANGTNLKSARHFRIINEVVTLFMVLTVVLVVFKPF